MTKRAQLGMALFLISEAVFFLLLILASLYFGKKPHLSLASHCCCSSRAISACGGDGDG